MGYAQPKDPLCAVVSPEELVWLDRMAALCNWTAWLPMGQGEYVAVYPLMFHWTMIRGVMFDEAGYEDRWCMKDWPTAAEALVDWYRRGFEGEPKGWHRHPKTSRRRTDGDPSKEYIAP